MTSKIERRIERESKNIPHVIPAYKIIEQVSGCGFIQDYVNEIIPVIEDDIQFVIDSPEKKNYSITELPTTFDIPGMTNNRAQMHVYFHLLRALKKADYFPKIEFINRNSHNQKVFLYIKWFSREDIEMERYMNKFIQAHDMTSSRANAENDKRVKPNPVRRRRRK